MAGALNCLISCCTCCYCCGCRCLPCCKKKKRKGSSDLKNLKIDKKTGKPIKQQPKGATKEKKKKRKCCPPDPTRLPGLERCHPCAWVPCSKRYKEIQKKRRKVYSGYKPTRWPTDVCCTFLFVMFWVGMVIIAGFAIWSGNPLTLIEPTDFQDNMCGYGLGSGNSNLYDLSDKPVLWYPFFFNTNELSKTVFLDALYMGICVESCPTRGLGLNISVVYNDFDRYKSLILEEMIICDYDHQGLTYTEKIYAVGNESGCYVNIFPTSTFQKRCIPTFTDLTNYTVPSAAQTYVDRFLKVGNTLRAGFLEVRIAWFPLVVNSLITLAVCFLMAFCINVFLKLFILFAVISIYVTLLILTGYSGYIAWDRYTGADNSGILDETERRISYVFMALAGAFFIASGLYLCIMFFLMRRIKKAVDVIQLAAKPIFRIPTLLIVPPLTFLALAAITAYWLIIAGHIQSATLPITLEIDELENLPVSNLPINASSTYTIRKGDTTIQGMQWVHLFGYLWTAAFLSAIGYTTTAGVVAQWFFSSKGNPDYNYRETRGYRKRAECFSVLRSFLRVLIFHTGSLLFGSIIVAIVQLFIWVYRKFERWFTRIISLTALIGSGGNPAVCICVCCCTCCCKYCVRCCMFSFYLLVKFFNRNAYVMMMIHGGGFLSSGARAFNLIRENILLVGTTNFIGHAMLFLGQLGISFWGGFQTYLIIDLFNRYEFRLFMGEVEYYVVPVIAGFVLSFIISGMFVSMYTTAIDTVLLCYLEDKKKRRKYPYTPPPLRDNSFFKLYIPTFVLMLKRRLIGGGRRRRNVDDDAPPSKKRGGGKKKKGPLKGLKKKKRFGLF